MAILNFLNRCHNQVLVEIEIEPTVVYGLDHYCCLHLILVGQMEDSKVVVKDRQEKMTSDAVDSTIHVAGRDHTQLLKRIQQIKVVIMNQVDTSLR